MADKKSEKKQNKKIVYLPFSIIFTYSILLCVLITTLFILGPIAFDYFREMVHWGAFSSYYIFLVFIITLAMTIATLFLVIYMNERIKNRHKFEEEKREAYNSLSLHGSYDPDRGALEHQIAHLTNQLLISQERWEEVNHLILSSHEKNISSSGIVSSSEYLGRFNISPNEITIDKRLIFVLTPFHDDNIADFYHIKKICEGLNFRTLRGDEELIEGDILSHVVKCIVKARIIIANINGRNPNVFYELGIAHALNKPTILVAHSENEIPFDLKNRSVVIYDSEEELTKKLNFALGQILID